MCMARIGNEVTNALIEEHSGAVSKNAVFGLMYEILERVFVLRHDLRDTGQVGLDNGEIEGGCHKRTNLKNTKRETRR